MAGKVEAARDKWEVESYVVQQRNKVSLLLSRPPPSLLPPLHYACVALGGGRHGLMSKPVLIVLSCAAGCLDGVWPQPRRLLGCDAIGLVGAPHSATGRSLLVTASAATDSAAERMILSCGIAHGSARATLLCEVP